MIRSSFPVLAIVVFCLNLACPVRVGAQESDPRLHANGPGWRVERAKIENDQLPRVLLIGDSILNGWKKYTFTFVPKVADKVALCVKCDTGGQRKPIWTAYDNLSVEGAALKNGDFETLDPQGKLDGWYGAGYELKSERATSGKNFVKVLTEGGLAQDISLEVDKPVTVSFYARIANGMESE